MNSISVIVIVYNEEERIENFIKNFMWSDDIVIVDKSSTDRTRDIAAEYPVNIIKIPYTDDQKIVGEVGISVTKNQWVMLVTASDIIHPKLVKELLSLVNLKDHNFDIIKGPGCRYVLGINNKRSMWYAGRNQWILAYKKNIVSFSTKIHESIVLNSERIYVIDFPEADHNFGLLHLTHEDVSSALERTIRYCRESEVIHYENESIALKTSLKEVIKGVINSVIRKKTWLLGWDGIAITFNYLVYYMVKYLFIWDKYRGNGKNIYREINKLFIKAWEEESSKQN